MASVALALPDGGADDRASMLRRLTDAVGRSALPGGAREVYDARTRGATEEEP